jgi:transposase
MAAPISLRGDFDGPMLRALVLAEKVGSVTRRLLSLVTIYDGGSRADAALLGGVGLQTIRDWVLRFKVAHMGSVNPPPLGDRDAMLRSCKTRSAAVTLYGTASIIWFG